MNRSLLIAWEQTARAAPATPVLTDAATGRTLTRTELDLRADDWHRRHGGALARRLVVFAELNGVSWFVTFLGLLKSGAVLAPLDPGDPPVTREATARQLGAAFLWHDGQLQPLARRPRCRDDRRLVKLTSGSTGTPRAVPFTDAQLLADGRQVCGTMGITAADVNHGIIPFGHSYALGNIVIPLLAQGTAVVCGSAALPHVLAGEIARHRATLFPAVPALLRALAVSEVPPGQLASLRTVISAGAPLPAETARAFHDRFGRRIHGFYGATETGGITYDRSGDATLAGRSVGSALDGVQLAFTPRHRFLVTSPAVFTLGNRRRHSDRDLGVHQPADLGALDARGELTLLGRTGRTVKIAGRRLDLAEIEHTLRQLAGVRDAFVAPHARRADALAAAVVSDAPAPTLRAALGERLAPWKIPRSILVLAEFPLTARGKPDLRRLGELLAAHV